MDRNCLGRCEDMPFLPIISESLPLNFLYRSIKGQTGCSEPGSRVILCEEMSRRCAVVGLPTIQASLTR
jgi:hypothetical protein